MATIRERVKNLCNEYQVSMNKLESELGFAKGYLSKLDKSTPNSNNLQKIADFFNVTLDYLVTGETTYSSNGIYEAKNSTERELLVLCRSIEGASEEDKKRIINNFKNTIDIFLEAKGLK